MRDKSMAESAANRISLPRSIAYGTGGAGENIAYGLFYGFFMFFMTSVAGIDSGMAGTISLIAVMWDAISDPLVGYLSDRYKGNKWGKRTPFVLAGAIPLGLTVFLLFCDVNMGQTAKGFYLLTINIAFWFFFTVTDLPYIVAASEITDDYDTKTRLRTVTLVFMCLSSILVYSGTTKFLDVMASHGYDAASSWRIAGAVMGGITAASFLIAALALKGAKMKSLETPGVKKGEKTGTKSLTEAIKVMKKAFSIRQYRLVGYIAFLYNLSLGIYQSAMLYYALYRCGFTMGQISVITFWPGIVFLVFVMPAGEFIVKYGKRNGMIIGFAISGAALGLAFLITPNALGMMAILLGVQVTNVVFWIVIYGLNFDTSIIYAYKFGERNDGYLLSATSFAIKLGMAIGMWLTGMCMQWFSVNPHEEVVTEAMGRSMSIIYGGIPCIITVAAILCCLFYKTSKANISAMEQAMVLREAGEEYDESPFSELL